MELVGVSAKCPLRVCPWLRRVDWWLDRYVWFRVSQWVRWTHDPEVFNRPMIWLLQGVFEFSWIKFCGYGWGFAWKMGCIYWYRRHEGEGG